LVQGIIKAIIQTQAECQNQQKNKQIKEIHLIRKIIKYSDKLLANDYLVVFIENWVILARVQK
jgi:hypothetical protein